MKFTPQANLFVLKPRPVESNGAAAAPFATPTVEPLKSIRPNGSDGSISPLQARLGVRQISNLDWASIAMTLHQAQAQSGSVAGQPPSSSPALAPASTPSWAQGLPVLSFAPGPQVGTSQAAGAATANPSEASGLKDRSKAAWSVWSGTTAVLHVTEGVSQSHVAGMASTLGFSQSQASGFADSVVRFMHGQGGQAITIAVTFGGIGGAVATLLGYKKHAVAIGVVTGIAAGLLFFLIPNHPSPYEGKWTMNALETEYQAGAPPRQATEEISEDNRGLKIKRISILEGGQRESQTYHVHTDSAPYKSELTGDSVVTTKDGDTLTSVYSRNGQTVGREIMTLAADHKRMTVTASNRAPSGELLDNVTVYDRE